MQAPYKEQKASNAAHLPPYWNVLSFSFTIIEFSLAISFRMVMQHTSCYHPPEYCCLVISFRMVMQHTSCYHPPEYCGLVISFRMVMQHASPLAKGRKRGDYLCRTDVKNYKRWTHYFVRPSLLCYTIPEEKVI